MRDEEFDKLLKKQIQEDQYIPKEINQLFSDFGMEVNMKENLEKPKIFKVKRILSIAASLMIVVFLGGSTYAHINGKETIISPLLRNLGINSKYEENATQFNEEVSKEDITIKMIDGAIDGTSLILGYEIDIENNNPDNWLEINGEYRINNISVKPIASTMDKLSDTSYVYYQIFDVNEIKIDDKENVKIDTNIYEIKEYTESETLDSVEAVYGKSHIDEWNFQENISVKNFEESKTYEFEDNTSYEVIENVNISVNKFIKGAYTNVLKIKTDKTNYVGDDFEKYYKILDEQDNEIAMFLEEETEYDHTLYNDRLILKDLKNNSKIKIEVYIRMIDRNNFEKVATIQVDLDTATEKVVAQEKDKKYKNEKYSFKYNGNWNLIEKVDTNRVGPNSIYLGALELEIPSTTNSEYTSSIYVKTINQNFTLSQYIEQIRNKNTESPSEYYEEKSSSDINFKNYQGYQITACTTDGETMYIKKDIFTIQDGIVYNITFFGSEKEYNNLKKDIEEFVNNFEI